MTVTVTQSKPSTGDGSLILFSWALTTANPDGAPVGSAEWADRTWQAVGTWGTAILALQGSNDGINWFSMSNAAGGVAIAITANLGVASIELPLMVRPVLTTVGIGAAVTVTCLMRRATPMPN